MNLLGKGFGYILLGLIQTVGVILLAIYGKDVAALTGPLGAINVAVYGGGVGKVWLQSKKAP